MEYIIFFGLIISLLVLGLVIINIFLEREDMKYRETLEALITYSNETCPICGSKEVCEKPDDYGYYECKSCGCVFGYEGSDIEKERKGII